MSTIKTFGDVDARSLEQLERRMAAGDADFGVLCADHHVGYTQPSGGAVASRTTSAGRDWSAVQARLREQGIVLVGGGADEAPEVYKHLPDVLAAHGETIRVKHTLRPLGVAMAGRDVQDPYKD